MWPALSEPGQHLQCVSSPLRLPTEQGTSLIGLCQILPESLGCAEPPVVALQAGADNFMLDP